MEIDSMPIELDDVLRKLAQKEVERHVLAKEKDGISKTKTMELTKEIDELKQKENKIRELWNEEKKGLDNIKKLKIELDNARNELSNVLNKAEYDKAAKLQYSVIPNLESKINELTNHDENKLLSEIVTSEDIASIVAKWTNIPVTKLMSEDREKLLNLETTLKKRVIGQDQAIKYVSDAIIRQRAGVKQENKPIGSFLFLGPTGVGKTEVARSLADALFDSANQIIRLDMSEYMESHSIAKLIGSPPGYVGYEEGGQLTENVKRKPYSIILFDEIEKAHKDVCNVLLQILDDGRLTDGKGKVVDFKNTIIIMTSNLGSDILLKGEPDSESKVLSLVKQNFKPEFINRIDEIVVFSPLGYKTQAIIARKLLNDYSKLLSTNNINITFTDEVVKFVLDEGFDSEFGARPLKRYIQRNVEVFISKAIIKNEILPNYEYQITVKDKELLLLKMFS
jgi:ATP-dependent Clp protease ATP-binding subunit ClpB